LHDPTCVAACIAQGLSPCRFDRLNSDQEGFAMTKVTATKKAKAKEAPIPPNAIKMGGEEILRGWLVGDQDVEVSIKSAFEDPFLWGIFLVDVAKNAAMAYERETDMKAQEAFARIIAGFSAEVDNLLGSKQSEPKN
jgi:hypothetical protein